MSDLPQGWAETTLYSVAVIVRGVTYDKSEAVSAPAEGFLPILRATNIEQTLNLTSEMVYVPEQRVKPTQRMQPGDIVIAASSGSLSVVGKSAPLLTSWEGGFGAFCAVVRPAPDLSTHYLSHFVSSPRVRKAWRELAQGTNINNLKASDLGSTTVPVPPRPEQERIVAALEEQFSRLDAGVVALERVRRNLKRMSDAVLDAAVAGRLVPQIESEGTGEQLLSTIRLPEQRRRGSAPRNEFTTALPTLPSSWATARWASVGLSQNGRAFPSSEYAAAGRRLLRPGNLNANGTVVWNQSNTRCMPEAYALGFPGYLVGRDEIVINLTAQSLKDEFLGRVCMTGPGESVLLNQRIARLTPVGLHPRFVFWVLKSPVFRRFVDQLNTGSLIQHMFTSQLDEFVLPIPPYAEQLRIVARVEAIISGSPVLEKAIRDALARDVSLRASALAAAMSGKLVPQDPNDEPAAILLERIAAYREPPNSQKPSPPSKSRDARIKVSA